MNSIYELLQLSIELIQIKQEIKEIYARRDEIEKEQAELYKRIKDYCGHTGETTKGLLDALMQLDEGGAGNG